MLDEFVCIIPARGGSVGIPKKNLQLVSGVPLVVYSIRSAIESGIPCENIIVSSDDSDILKLAKTWGVIPHKRPDKISTGQSSTEEAMLDVLESYKSNKFDSMILLQPTSPIRLKGRILDAINKYIHGNFDSLLSTTKLYPFMWKEVNDELINSRKFISTFPPRDRPMRQDLTFEDYLYFDNGNIYITKVEVLLRLKCRIGENVCVYPITEIEAMQIDTPFDLKVIDKMISASGWIFRFPVEHV